MLFSCPVRNFFSEDKIDKKDLSTSRWKYFIYKVDKDDSSTNLIEQFKSAQCEQNDFRQYF